MATLVLDEDNAPPQQEESSQVSVFDGSHTSGDRSIWEMLIEVGRIDGSFSAV